MEYMTFTGKTISDALTAASVKLGVTSEKISYTVVEKGSTGLFGLGSKNAVIRAKINQDQEEVTREVAKEAEAEFSILKEKDQPDAEETTSSQVDEYSGDQAEKEKGDEKIATPASDRGSAKKADHSRKTADPQEIQAIASAFLTDLFAAMKMDVKAEYQFDVSENTLNINLSGPEMGVIIGKRGQTLDSLQYLTNLAVNRKSSVYSRVKIDTEDYRARRMATLENLAKNVAFRVKRSGRAEELEAMNPYERRIIHSALQGIQGVDTHSEGEEPYRHVVISPKDGHAELSL